jgi:hypothetical protein
MLDCVHVHMHVFTFVFACMYLYTMYLLSLFPCVGHLPTSRSPDLSNAASALQMLFDGRNDGKLVVRIDPSAQASEAVLRDLRNQSSKL